MPGDISPTSGSLSFSDGDSSALIEFRVTDDTIPDMSCLFRVVLHSPVGGARLGETELVVTIEESDDYMDYSTLQRDLSHSLFRSLWRMPLSHPLLLLLLSGIKV